MSIEGHRNCAASIHFVQSRAKEERDHVEVAYLRRVHSGDAGHGGVGKCLRASFLSRPAGQERESWATGEIEVEVEQVNILNPSRTPPIPIGEEEDEPNEAERMKYRYLDLRETRAHAGEI